MAEPHESTPNEPAVPRDEAAYLRELSQRSLPGRLKGYLGLSGPGWLQSALTLGGGSLASSLYLGVLAGFSLLWLQPFAMILGIIMLSAIGYVTLSTGERPFRAINQHVNPVLGWGWALAVAAANIVWCMPQYSLANSVLSQNLLPGVLGDEGRVSVWATTTFGAQFPWAADNASKLVVALSLLLIATAITWSYDRGGQGIKIYENILKLFVALIVTCFVGVVIKLGLSEGGLDWNAVWAGFIPDFTKFQRPADTFLPMLEAIGPAGHAARDFWTSQIVSQQRDVMISAAATAVGINMTFLFAYSLLRKGWTRHHRGLAIFDLSTGMFIPYVLATGCVVIAAASQFHTQIDDGFVLSSTEVTAPAKFEKPFTALLDNRSAAVEAEVSLAEKQLAAALVNRDAMDLAQSLAPLTGNTVANIVFGVGVVAMTLSSITLLMLISGFVFCEILGFPPGGWPHRIGTLVAGLGGMLGPFFWSQAAFYLAVPTSVFGFVLLPFAYITFALLMNQKKLLGQDVPTGMRRVVWNTLMGIAATIASVGSLYMIWTKAGIIGIAAVVAFVLLALMVQINRHNEAKYNE